MKDEDIFIVRKELVIAVYEMISAQDPFIQLYRKTQQYMSQASFGGHSNMMNGNGFQSGFNLESVNANNVESPNPMENLDFGLLAAT